MQVFKTQPIEFVEIGYRSLTKRENRFFLKRFADTVVSNITAEAVRAVAYAGFTREEFETVGETETNICFIEGYGFVLIVTTPSIDASAAVRTVHLKVNEKNITFKLEEETGVNNQREKELKNSKLAKLLELPVLAFDFGKTERLQLFKNCELVGSRLNATTIQSVLDTVPPTWGFKPMFLALRSSKLHIEGKHRFGALSHILCDAIHFTNGNTTYILQTDE